LGYSSAELLLKSIHEIIPPENRETDYQNFIDLTHLENVKYKMSSFI